MSEIEQVQAEDVIASAIEACLDTPNDTVAAASTALLEALREACGGGDTYVVICSDGTLANSLITLCQWGQITPGGPLHAFDMTPWVNIEPVWVARCSGLTAYSQTDLASLDDQPGARICGHPGCARAARANARVLAAEQALIESFREDQ